MTETVKDGVKGYLFALAATAFWSGNHFIARALRESIPPVSLAFLRWAAATLAFLPFALPGAVRERRAVLRSLPYLALTALLGVSLFNTLIYYAGRTTTALNLSLISLIFPVIILLLSRIFLGERMPLRRLAGIAVVLAGVAVLVTKGRLDALRSIGFAPGDLLMLLAALVFSVYTLLLKRKPEGLSLSTLQFATFALGTLMLAPAFAWERASAPPVAWTPALLGAVLYVGVFASLAAFVSWNQAIERIGTAKAGLVYYTLPIWSGLLAWVFLGEAPTAAQAFSMALVVGGIVVAR
ncbi:MAG TPA: DMT family transporter [Spirochaetia bacterium]|nr:DMT family transporter [Spirochaetales bacterium]HRY81910.1 DMT family transporter [Spirochaetia bacterium]